MPAAAATPMDRIYRRIDFEQLKLPLGFVRLLEVVFCLIAFAAFHGWRFVLTIQCPDPDGKNTSKDYDFKSLDIDTYQVKSCNNTTMTPFADADYGSGPSFYSFLVPLSLIVAVSGVLFYVFCYNLYASDDRIPVLDLVVTVLLALGWMLATMSFSYAARTIDAATAPDQVITTLHKEPHNVCHGAPGGECEVKSYNVHGTLTIATIAGVALFILFTTNTWFIYKETPFHRDRQARRNMHPHNNLPANEPYTLE